MPASECRWGCLTQPMGRGRSPFAEAAASMPVWLTQTDSALPQHGEHPEPHIERLCARQLEQIPQLLLDHLLRVFPGPVNLPKRTIQRTGRR